MSGSISYYENLIDECNERILKYKGQIDGLESFKTENTNGAEIFSTVTEPVKDEIILIIHYKIQ